MTNKDIYLTKAGYLSLYAEASIALGSSVTVQNKSSGYILLQNNTAKPAVGSTDGYILAPFETIPVTGTILNLWAIGEGPVSVEVIT